MEDFIHDLPLALDFEQGEQVGEAIGAAVATIHRKALLRDLHGLRFQTDF